jgi:hypothetical protein
MRLSDAYKGVKACGKVGDDHIFRGDIDPEWRVGE